MYAIMRRERFARWMLTGFGVIALGEGRHQYCSDWLDEETALRIRKVVLFATITAAKEQIRTLRKVDGALAKAAIKVIPIDVLLDRKLPVLKRPAFILK